MKSISVDPDFIIHDMETEKVLYKGHRKYGATSFYTLLRKILNDKQMFDWVGGEEFVFKIPNSKYDLILKEDQNNG